LDKADKDLAFPRHMAFHYRVRNTCSKARIRNLKEKLKKATKRKNKQRDHDHLQILAKYSLAIHGT